MYFIESSADIIIKQQGPFSGCSEDYLRNTLQIKGQILVRFVILKLNCTPTCTEFAEFAVAASQTAQRWSV